MTGALVLQIFNVMQAGLKWLESRGITRARSIALLDKAKAEDRDITTAEVQVELNLAQKELDMTAEQIDQMPE
ncbi:hypothetical protein LCGC14_2886480 [marine sediment metagenome]|uniref:Uncharacterized protein n=1 Tax=marine sediment metagenome TaxID=412755 RepID=A0A0F8YKB7_9ZZZZ